MGASLMINFVQLSSCDKQCVHEGGILVHALVLQTCTNFN